MAERREEGGALPTRPLRIKFHYVFISGVTVIWKNGSVYSGQTKMTAAREALPSCVIQVAVTAPGTTCGYWGLLPMGFLKSLNFLRFVRKYFLVKGLHLTHSHWRSTVVAMVCGGAWCGGTWSRARVVPGVRAHFLRGA